MKRFGYQYKEGVLYVPVRMANHNEPFDFDFVVDTGASDSIVSSKAATFLGFDINAITDIDTGPGTYTASGIIHPKLITLTSFESLGRCEQDFRIRVVNFPDDTDGVLGIDFLCQFGWFKINFPDDIRKASIEVGKGIKGNLRLIDIAGIVKKVVMRTERIPMPYERRP